SKETAVPETGTPVGFQLVAVFQSELVPPSQVLTDCAFAEEGAKVRLRPQAAATAAGRRTRRRRSRRGVRRGGSRSSLTCVNAGDGTQSEFIGIDGGEA